MLPECSLNDDECDLNDDECSLNYDLRSLNYEECFLNDEECSLKLTNVPWRLLSQVGGGGPASFGQQQCVAYSGWPSRE